MKNKISNVSKEVFLTKGERDFMLSEIRVHMRKNKNQRLLMVPSPFGTVRLVTLQRVMASALVLVLVVGTTQVTLAAQNAIPGDTLYGMKRVSEDVHSAATFSDSAQVRLAGEHAVRRLRERAVLQQKGTLTDEVSKDLSESLQKQVGVLTAHLDIADAREDSITEGARALARVAGYANALDTSVEVVADNSAPTSATVLRGEDDVAGITAVNSVQTEDSVSDVAHNFVASQEYLLASKLDTLSKDSVRNLVKNEAASAVQEAESTHDDVTVATVQAFSVSTSASANEGAPLEDSLSALSTLTNIAEMRALSDVAHAVDHLDEGDDE